MLPVPKVLVVDDEPRMCDSLQVLLGDQGYEVFTANTGYQAMDFLSKDAFDVVLMDMVIPDINGYQLMDYINNKVPDPCVIVITGHASVDSAIGALRKGAYDYLRKPFEFDELLKTVQNALSQKKLKRENEILNEKLVMSEDRYRYLVHNSPDIIYTLDEYGNFTFINSATERLTGYKTQELVGKHYSYIVYGDDLEKTKWCFHNRRTGDRAASGIEVRLKICSNGKRSKACEAGYLITELKSTGMYDRPPKEKNSIYLGTHGVFRDISDRRKLESQLQQSQKMEAIGTLAGGIAHDFNNLLMGIQGRASLMLADIDASNPHIEHLKGIEEYIKSASDLTKQLLGFARGGKYEVKVIDLNDVIITSSKMFGRTKKEIRIHSKLQENLWSVEADQRQIEQVLLNLYVNAWQAMPAGGELYLQTENVQLAKDSVEAYQVKPGKYVRISVADTGVGMDEATMQRIFDPFFTTKEMGRGTGLGLASAYGIIQNHSGMIDVYSEKGKGTTFIIYLPASKKEVKKESETPEKLLLGSETVLLVDDEAMIIDVSKQLLEKLGYNVMIAKSGQRSSKTIQRES